MEETDVKSSISIQDDNGNNRKVEGGEGNNTSGSLSRILNYLPSIKSGRCFRKKELRMQRCGNGKRHKLLREGRVGWGDN